MAKLWPVEEAERLLKNLPGDYKTVVFETGFGPSGLPHIGTFGEVSRTTFVRQAFSRISALPTRLIAFCDDMDGLRKVPLNIPNREQVAEHLGKPLVHVPDPYGCCASFAHHMERKLKEFLDSFGFDYELKSAHAEYTAGAFNRGLERALEQVEKIREIIIPTMQKENREQWSPFLPICQACGKNLTTRVIAYSPDKHELEYACDQEAGEALRGCGHRAVTGVHNGQVKLGWKADWALRWAAYGVHYEMYGKDLIESFNISKKIVRLLGGRAPENMFYELFLDESGAKISKSVGKGLTIDTWINYAPLPALSYFMFQNPRKAKKFHFDVIPKTVDEYLDLLRAYCRADKDKRAENPIAFVHPDLDDKKLFDAEISYSLINNLISALGTEDMDLVMDYIRNYDPAAREYEGFIRGLAEKALAYYRDEILPNKQFKTPAAAEQAALKTLLARLAAETQADANVYQTHVFETAREHAMEPRDFFLLIYQVLFGQQSGPKVGSFIKLVGRDEFCRMLKARGVE
jgi:lysyl-tRNA synthetase class 1